MEEHTPPSIFIDLNQSQVKAPHLCKFEDCTRPRRGYNDFCRQHRAIGKIISGKIARDKAIAEIAARDKSNEVTEVNRTGSEYENRHRKKPAIIGRVIAIFGSRTCLRQHPPFVYASIHDPRIGISFSFLEALAISRADCSNFALCKSSPPGHVSLWPQFLHVRLLFARGICDKSQVKPSL